MTASFSPTTIAAPGSGTSTMTMTAASTVTAGSYVLTITATGGGVTRTSSVMVDVQDIILAGAQAITLVPNSTAELVLTAVPEASFSAAVTLSVSGLPAFVPASLSATSIPAPVLSAVMLTTFPGTAEVLAGV